MNYGRATDSKRPERLRAAVSGSPGEHSVASSGAQGGGRPTGTDITQGCVSIDVRAEEGVVSA